MTLNKKLAVYFKTPEELIQVQDTAEKRNFRSASSYLRFLFLEDKRKNG